jgi:signal transduction histidine kinase/CheY-like chemotaxis protein
MSPLMLLLTLGPVVVLGCFYLRRIAEGGAGRWAWAWAALWAAGTLGFFGNTALGVSHVPGALFMAFTLAGAIEFRGGVPPRWMLPACASFGLVRCSLTLAGRPDLSYAIALPYELLLGSLSFWQVRRAPREYATQPSHLLLGPALFGLALLDVVDVALRWLGHPMDVVIVLWVAGGFAAVLIQIVAVVDRLRLRELRARGEREELAAAIEGERRTLRAVLDAAPVGVFLLDPAWRITMANRLGTAQWELGTPEDWLGRRGEEAMARCLDRLLDPRPFRTTLRGLLQDPLAVIDSLEVTFVAPDERVLSLYSSPVLSEEGEHIGRVFTSRDATEERRLEAELRQAQKMETLGTLAGGIAHDFNNQLTAILGNARFAFDGIPEGHEARAALRDLTRAAEHCAALTRSLLAFARRAPSEPRASDVAEVACEVERLLRATLQSGVRFTLASAPALHAAHVDPTQLQQILLNLCLNARDAVGSRGSITLSARNRGLPPAEARELGLAPGDYVEVEVREDGAGMDAWTRARVFDPFFTTKPVGAGTGLGLAVVYGLVRGHGGWIGVDSEPGRGASFRVLLPVASEAPLPEAPEAVPPARGRGEVVLVAEDEAVVRRVVASVLRRAGYRVIEAADGAEAVASVAERGSEIALAVLDLTMPRLDGLAALAAMRDQRPGLRALLVSGRFPASLAAPPPDAELLAKPFEPAELAARVRALLDRPT